MRRQSMEERKSFCASDSTPSAIASISRHFAMNMMVVAMAASSEEVTTSLTKDLSILSAWKW